MYPSHSSSSLVSFQLDCPYPPSYDNNQHFSPCLIHSNGGDSQESLSELALANNSTDGVNNLPNASTVSTPTGISPSSSTPSLLLTPTLALSPVSSSANSPSSPASPESHSMNHPSHSLSGDEQCILFLGDLARSVTEDDVLHVINSTFGSDYATAADVKRDKITGNNLGYGFVQLNTREQAEIVKRDLNGTG